MTIVNKNYKNQRNLLITSFIILFVNSSCMLSASMKSLDLGLDTTKPSESPSSGNINPDFELQVVVDSENGKRLDAPEIALYNGDTINLFSVKSLAKSDHLTANSVDWSYTTDTATTLVVASDKKSAVLNVTGVGSLTVNISCEGKTKTYSVIINVRPNLIANSVKTTCLTKQRP